jgi:hypothetical protein
MASRRKQFQMEKYMLLPKVTMTIALFSQSKINKHSLNQIKNVSIIFHFHASGIWGNAFHGDSKPWHDQYEDIH